MIVHQLPWELRLRVAEDAAAELAERAANERRAVRSSEQGSCVRSNRDPNEQTARDFSR